jgi:hypothetical protein
MKYISLFIMLLYAGALTSQNVSLTIQGPEQVYSGSDIIVNIYINKGNTEGFGRLTVKIPSGFEPIEKKSHNGKYEFDGEDLKIIWIKLPEDRGFAVSFGLKVAPNVEGYKVLRGELSVGSSDGTFRAEARPHIMTVTKTENIAKTEQVVFEYSYIKKMGVSAIRQKPYLSDSGYAEVDVLLNKGDLSGFGKIEETVPAGYTAESEVSNGAIFVFNKTNRTIKFLWMNLPEEQHFIVSYLLKPDEGSLDDIPFIITGQFMYAEGSTTKTVEINERNINLKEMMEK